MGISVLLVDDEKLERVLIRQGFDWESHGFSIIGEAECGEDALEFVRYRRPDVVVTDISMPRMDGLALTEEIKKIYPGCRIVIVTGYREFDYARQAIRLGVEDFLLKPVNIRDMEEVVCRIREQVEWEKQQSREVEELKQSVLADQDIVQESFWQRLVSGRVPEEEAVKKLTVYNHAKLLSGCICVNIHVRGVRDEKLTALLQEVCPEDVLCFQHYMQNGILFFAEEKTDREMVRKAAEEIHAGLKERQAEAVIGISAKKQGVRGFCRAYEESEKAVGASVYLGGDRVISYEQYEEIMRQQSEKEEMDWEKLSVCLENGLESEMNVCVREYMERVWSFKMQNAEMLRLMTMNFLTKAGASLNKYGMSLVQLTDEESLYHEIGQIGTVEEMEQVLRRKLQMILDYHNSKKEKKKNRTVEEALLFIQKNLYEPTLSLKTIAAGVFSNESYLSRVFKKEMDISLIEYITKKRIEESMRLLDTTDLKVYEIAERIGFRDSHYFSICFKKYTGKTVKEYKTV